MDLTKYKRKVNAEAQSGRSVLNLSKSPDPKLYLKPKKLKEIYSDFYRKIFEKEDYKNKLKLIKVTSKQRKLDYVQSIGAKLKKLQSYRFKGYNDTSQDIVCMVPSAIELPRVYKKLQPIELKKGKIMGGEGRGRREDTRSDFNDSIEPSILEARYQELLQQKIFSSNRQNTELRQIDGGFIKHQKKKVKFEKEKLKKLLESDRSVSFESLDDT